MSNNTHNSQKSVIKYYINGLSRSEISEITGISTGTVSNVIKNWKETINRYTFRNSPGQKTVYQRIIKGVF
ncbi:MAG: helix-turn-helix domain containing protein [Candidatus Nitrosocosmicus sp.]|nr:helix-turn-helix domain containing protein [Candidatus Nitrosocosmicus sp.]